VEFKNPQYPESFKIFAKRKNQTENWILYGVEIGDASLEKTISNIQQQMKEDEPYYAHFYNDQKLIVIFKNKVFYVTPQKDSWKEIIEYGKSLNIPKEQLDFWPNRFQDEIHYFNKKDYIL
jgi:hypothetical protein